MLRAAKQKPAYLEPNSGSLHVPIEGVYRVTEKIEGRSAIGAETAQKYVENRRRTYLQPNRNTLQKPVGGLSALALHCPVKVEPLIPPLNKGAIVSTEHNRNRSFHSGSPLLASALSCMKLMA